MENRHDSLDIRRPQRARHSFTQTIEGSPEEVFPLLCPVRELDWAPGWDPDWVISASGVAEPDCVFQTPGELSPALWVITRHDPDKQVEMIKFTPGHTVCKLEIELQRSSEKQTRVTVAYQHTSLGPEGDAFLAEFTADSYRKFMRGWEAAMNHWLRTGRIMPAEDRA